jgi:ribosomal protein S6--L-glutamate ligase
LQAQPLTYYQSGAHCLRRYITTLAACPRLGFTSGRSARKTGSPMPRLSAPFILGREEWVVLPELGLGAIKVKVDTGARTSALHAFYVEPFGPARARKVRFGVHPLPRRSDVAIECTARLIDQRVVTSSNGEREQRYVIETPIRIGDRQWRIEVTLANRNMMSYRMLLGRQAIPRDSLVNPSASFLQPKLHYKVYGRLG